MPMAKTPTSLIEDDYAEPFKQWKAAPGPAANAAILKTIDPIIQGAVKTHVGQPNPLIVSRARRMALSGLGSYDPSRGRLQTHLYSHLQGLKRVNRQQTQILAVPERIQLDRYQLDEMTRQLGDELGREPTDGELCDRMGFSPRRLARVRSFSPAVAEGRMEDPETGAAYGGAVKDPVAEAKSAWVQLVYDDLDPYHQKIMELALGLNGRRPLPNQVIARKMGRSPGAISQAKARIQKMLDEEAELSPFARNQ